MENFPEFGKAENVDFASTLLDSVAYTSTSRGFKYSDEKGKKRRGTKGNAVEGVVKSVRIYVSMSVFVGMHDDEFCSQFT